MKKNFPIFEIVITLIFILTLAYGALAEGHNFSLNWFDRDDAYYYYKVAQNITEGHGITFDGINPTNGYHPLWMLVCIPIFYFARYDLILPLRILFVVIGLIRLCTAIYLYHFLKRIVSVPIAMFFASFWAFNNIIGWNIYQNGLETGVASLFIIVLLYGTLQKEQKWQEQPASAKDIILIAFIAVLTMFSRLDLVFLAVIIGFRVIFRGTYMKDLLGLDLLIIVTSIVSGFILRMGLPEYYQYASSVLAMIAVSSIVRIPIFYFFGLYDNTAQQSPFEILKRVLSATILGSFIIVPLMLVLSVVLHFDSFSRLTLLYDLFFLTPFMIGSRLIMLWFTSKNNAVVKTPVENLKKNWKRWCTDGALYYGVVFGALIIYMLFNHFTFGTSSPVSGQIKRWWGEYSNNNAYGGAASITLDYYAINPRGDFNAFPHLTNVALKLTNLIFGDIKWSTVLYNRYSAIVISIVVIAFLILAFQRKYSSMSLSRLMFLPLVTASGLQLFSYNAGGYAGIKEWYWVAQYFIVIVISAVLVDLFARRLSHLKGGVTLLYLLVVPFILIDAQWSVEQMRADLYRREYSTDVPFMEAVPFLEMYTPPGSLIGMTGGGNAGYFIHDRTIVNMDGLINSPQYFKALQSQTADKYLANIGLDYIFSNEAILEGTPYYDQFESLYEIGIDRFGGKVLIKLKQDVK